MCFWTYKKSKVESRHDLRIEKIKARPGRFGGLLTATEDSQHAKDLMRRNLNSIWRIGSQLNLSNREIEVRICRYDGLSFTTIEDVHTVARILYINWQVFTSWFACASSSWKLELSMTKNNETKNVTAVQTLQGGAKHSPLASPEGVIGGVTGI